MTRALVLASRVLLPATATLAQDLQYVGDVHNVTPKGHAHGMSDEVHARPATDKRDTLQRCSIRRATPFRGIRR